MLEVKHGSPAGRRAPATAARDDRSVLSPFGLCDACAHQKRVGNTRGSSFSLCGLARTDERFPKYPRMPVLRCDGFARRDDPALADGPPTGALRGREDHDARR